MQAIANFEPTNRSINRAKSCLDLEKIVLDIHVAITATSGQTSPWCSGTWTRIILDKLLYFYSNLDYRCVHRRHSLTLQRLQVTWPGKEVNVHTWHLNKSHPMYPSPT